MTEKELYNGIKKVAATSPHGVCLWAKGLFDKPKTYLSMGVVKIDSCEPDWDTHGMQYGRPRAEAAFTKAIDDWFIGMYNQLPDRGGA